MAWTITARFGPTDEPLDSGYGGYAHFNKGVDFGIPLGTQVPAFAEGRVEWVGDKGDGWGISVKVRDAQGNLHNYGHLSGTNVGVGAQIKKGMIVGKSGSTGASTGPHLSYDVLSSGGQWIDPSPWVGQQVAGDNRGGGGGGQYQPGQGTPAPNYSTVDQEVYGNMRTADYYTKFAEWAKIDEKVILLESLDGVTVPDQYGQPQSRVQYDGQNWFDAMTGEVIISAADYTRYKQLDDELMLFEQAYEESGGNLDDIIRLAEWNYGANPEVVAAQNAADKHARELDERQQALDEASEAIQQQESLLAESRVSKDLFLDRGEEGKGFSSGHYVAPPKKIASMDELFAKAIENVGKALPDVPDMPAPPTLSMPERRSAAGLAADAYAQYGAGRGQRNYPGITQAEHDEINQGFLNQEAAARNPSARVLTETRNAFGGPRVLSESGNASRDVLLNTPRQPGAPRLIRGRDPEETPVPTPPGQQTPVPTRTPAPVNGRVPITGSILSTGRFNDPRSQFGSWGRRSA